MEGRKGQGRKEGSKGGRKDQREEGRIKGEKEGSKGGRKDQREEGRIKGEREGCPACRSAGRFDTVTKARPALTNRIVIETGARQSMVWSVRDSVWWEILSANPAAPGHAGVRPPPGPFVYSSFVYSPFVYSPFVYSPFVYSPFVYSPFVYSPFVYSSFIDSIIRVHLVRPPAAGALLVSAAALSHRHSLQL
jgi:hypothetical protein